MIDWPVVTQDLWIWDFQFWWITLTLTILQYLHHFTGRISNLSLGLTNVFHCILRGWTVLLLLIALWNKHLSRRSWAFILKGHDRCSVNRSFKLLSGSLQWTQWVQQYRFMSSSLVNASGDNKVVGTQLNLNWQQLRGFNRCSNSCSRT